MPYNKYDTPYQQEIIRQCLRIIQYIADDTCWPNPLIRIAKEKSWAWVTCEHPKSALYLMVMSKTLLVKEHSTKYVML